jgi:two-component system cell cycle sensor histidine kinase/response regulator CckA
VVESQEGVGSCFSVYLPSSSARPLDAAPPLEPELPTGQGTILVAEDEDLVRAAVCGLLTTAGYSVLEARDGAAALELLDSGHTVDLVLLDVVMPKLGGPQTLARLRERWPALKVILSSGYRDGAGVDSVPKGMSVLEKPYRSDDLLRRIQAELDAS